MEKDARRPIIIEGAMESEISYITASLAQRRERMLCGYQVTEGLIDGWPVIAARTQVGMTNAAILTTALCLEYAPLCLISQGTAGSHSAQLHTGDIVLGRGIRCLNSFAMSAEDADEVEKLSRGEWQKLRCLEPSPELLELALKTPYSGGRLTAGVIGSGDFWTHGNDAIESLSREFGTACEEMESFAAALACLRSDVPFLSVRILSNNELCGEDFDEDTAQICQSYVLSLVRSIIGRQKP